MKRLVSLIIIAALSLCLFGCGKEEPAAPATQDVYAGTFRIGYGRTDITPLTSVPLAGFGNATQRMSQNVLDPQLATALPLRTKMKILCCCCPTISSVLPILPWRRCAP